MSCCANCGIAEGDNIKLRTCAACHLVKYCGVACQKEHRPKHKSVCKKRAAELKDELLFRQPESNYLGDCPICFLPLPLTKDKSALSFCCSKLICIGCDWAHNKAEAEGGQERSRCPFCRELPSVSDAERMEDKAAELKDLIAMQHVGLQHNLAGDYQTALKFWSKAAELGDPESNFQIGCLYDFGDGVEKDESKAIYHYEQASVGGHPFARHNLANIEYKNGRLKKAIKHLIIAAKAGYADSLNVIETLFKLEFVSKEEFNSTLRGYQAAVDAMKSPQRAEAEKMRKPIQHLKHLKN